MKIKEFADFCSVSVRTLHYYDETGLLKPAFTDSKTGYRFYDENSLSRMQEIMFFRELDFSLRSIGEILASESYDRQKILREQRELLILKKERLERLIDAAEKAMKGEQIMDSFVNHDFEKYKDEVKKRWGDTDSYREYAEKREGYTKEKENSILSGMEDIFALFAEKMTEGKTADSREVQTVVGKLKEYITANFYTCTNEILYGLGQMYVGDERFKENIDRHAEGTAEFVSKAIEFYCK